MAIGHEAQYFLDTNAKPFIAFELLRMLRDTEKMIQNYIILPKPGISDDQITQ